MGHISPDSDIDEDDDVIEKDDGVDPPFILAEFI